MNDKEKLLYAILDNTISCCELEVSGTGTLSITREDVLGKSRAENLVMTRCILAAQLVHAGYSITTIAGLLNRSIPAVRHLVRMDRDYIDTSRAYRIASAQATLLNKDIEPCGL